MISINNNSFQMWNIILIYSISSKEDATLVAFYSDMEMLYDFCGMPIRTNLRNEDTFGRKFPYTLYLNAKIEL